jgi:hypothetical protein
MQTREERAATSLKWRARRELYDECAGDFTQVAGGRLEMLWQKYPPPETAAVPRTAVSGVAEERRTIDNCNSNIKTTQDIEDLIGKSPPCVAALLRQKRWYKDQERRQLVFQLKAGGASESLVARVFERAESHARGDDGTWDYKHAWKKETSYAQSCKTLIQNASENRGPCLKCVYANEADPRAHCLQTMPAARRLGMRYLNFPHQWYGTTTSASASTAGGGGGGHGNDKK